MFSFPTLVLMKGIPGSGKSSYAKGIARVLNECSAMVHEGSLRYLVGQEGVICSTDLYFLNEEGEYIFDPTNLAANHKLNQEAVASLMEDEEALIIVDNTNSQHWEMVEYIGLAVDHGYKVVVVEIPHPRMDEALARNGHGVPAAVIQAMLDRWEPGYPAFEQPSPARLGFPRAS